MHSWGSTETCDDVENSLLFENIQTYLQSDYAKSAEALLLNLPAVPSILDFVRARNHLIVK